MKFGTYQTDGFFDELLTDSGEPRLGSLPLINRLESLSEGELLHRQQAAESALYESGITFSVYGEGEATERIIPFDVVPRIIEADDWARVEQGLKQRIEALNLFLADIYSKQQIIADKVIPGSFIEADHPTWKKLAGLTPPRQRWCHISGIDLVRDADGFKVLEDNLRCPSGVSYVLENRRVLKQTFPRVFEALPIRTVDDYPERLLSTLMDLAPEAVDRPQIVVLTPGIYNSAYFEHAYLAQQMGVPLVQGSDLIVHDGYVMMRTTNGLARVDVIYRRIDDDFIDPTWFNPDSVLGVPGIMDVYAAGRVALANAPGCGIADNKVIYAFVPDMIRYYLKQDPILPNVETFLCARDADRNHVLNHLDELVVKPAHEAGGKGILIGPHASEAERDAMAEKINGDPDDFIAQPTLSLSRAPTIVEDHFEGRHVDLRPYILYGKDIYILPGGLTRVALRKGSLVVNSSQGGGTKDTWVLAEQPHVNGARA
jgi:uncharacterized circularly permuted ATP-grasp superfamily protein